MKYFTIQLCAQSTPNGNPRRAFVTFLTSDHSFIASYDEGYLGKEAITNKAHRAAFQGLRFDVTVSEYKYWTRNPLV